jgi:tetratricopeptide (TPR) repeat protein
VLFDEKKWTEAEAAFSQVLTMERRLHTNSHPDLEAALSNLANALEHQGKFGEAETFYRQSLAMRDELHKSKTGDDLARVLGKQGKLAELESLYHDRIAIFREGGAADSNLQKVLTSLAKFLREQRREAEAESFEREASDLARKTEPTASK